MKNIQLTICVVVLCLVCFTGGSVFWNYYRPDRYRIFSLEHRGHGYKNPYKIDTVTGKVWRYTGDENTPYGFYPVVDRTELGNIYNEVVND